MVCQLLSYNFFYVLTLFRFAFMDFIIFSTLIRVLVTALTLSYDICCQWSRNAKQCINQLLKAMQVILKVLLKKAKYIIPKFHLGGEGQCLADTSPYSFKCQLNEEISQ